MSIDDPALQLITAAVADDFDFADRLAAEYIDAGHADILIEGLADIAVTLIERIALVAAHVEDVHAPLGVITPKVWAAFCLELALEDS